MINSNKFSNNLKNDIFFNKIVKYIELYSSDLFNENCKEIYYIKLIKTNIENISELKIKYKNINNDNIIRIIKLKLNKKKNNYNNIKPFGKAIYGDNKPIIDDEINIICKDKLNTNINIKKLKETKLNKNDDKKKYNPPVTNNNFKIDVNFDKKYVPPIQKKFKLKIKNIGLDFNKTEGLEL